jgi:outer membrane protein OmpA-like peptidoglycan-associated protein
MKLQTITILLCTASLLAQEPTVGSSCRSSFDAVKNAHPLDAAAERIYANIERKIHSLEKPESERKSYGNESRACDLAVELLKVQLEKIALQKNSDHVNQMNAAIQSQISLTKDSLINLWAGDVQVLQSLNAAMLAERNRLKALSQEQKKTLAEKLLAIAERDSLLAIQREEADKKLDALNSKDMSVYKDARGTVLSMSDILFDVGKADLKFQLKENLSEVAAILKKVLTEPDIVIEGHTDNVGNAKSNQKLSEERAAMVLKYLVERGVEKERLQSIGYGLAKPIANNKTPEGRSKNRRVELIIKG